MKVKTRKLIAAITATALLGTVVGVSAYALSNSSNNDFGLKGTYSLNAFAEVAAAEKIEVNGASVDATSMLTLKSNDAAATYTLFVTVVDTDDMTDLTNIKVGYTIGTKTYSGISAGLSSTVYTSLTVDPSDSNQTVTAAELATNFANITNPRLVIAEVETETVGTNSAELTIVSSYSVSGTGFVGYDKSTVGAPTKFGDYITYYASSDDKDGASVTATDSDGITYTGAIQINGKTSDTKYRYFTIKPSAPCTVTLVYSTNKFSSGNPVTVYVGLTDKLTNGVSDGGNTGTEAVKVVFTITQDMIDNITNEDGVFYINTTEKVNYFYVGVDY